MKESIIREKPDLLIIGGDIFDENRVKNKALDAFIDFIYDLNENGIGVVTISGNHDGKYWKKHSFDYPMPFVLYKMREKLKKLLGGSFEYYSFVGYYTNPNSIDWRTANEIKEKYGIHIVGFSYAHKEEVSNLLANMLAVNNKLDNYIAVLHQSVKEIFPREDVSAISLAELEGNLSKAKYYLIGHMHMKYQKGKIFVSPSLYSLTKADSTQEKGFWIIDLDKGDFKFIPILDARKFIVKEIDLTKQKLSLEDFESDKEAILILRVYYTKEQQEKVNYLKKLLAERFLLVKVEPVLVSDKSRLLELKLKAKESLTKEEIIKNYLGKDYELFKLLFDKFRDADEDIIVKYFSDEENLDKILNSS